MKTLIKTISLCYLLFAGLKNMQAQNDLPSPTANIETIPAGAWIIPMDNTWQTTGGLFNLKAYGLVNQLLWNDIHVKWAIKAGKGQDSTDFKAISTLLFPTIDTSTLMAGANFETTTLSPAWAYTGTGGTNTTANKYNDGKSWRMAKNQSITMTNTSLANYSNVQLSVAFASSGSLPSSGDLYLDISYDNGSTWTGTGSVKLASGGGSAFNINTTNGNTVSPNPYIVNIPSTASQINVRLRTPNTGTWSSCFYYVDDIKLTGTYSRSYASGPFIIMPADTAAARSVIDTYNSSLTTDKINVYKTTTSNNIDIRYTLVHKPLAAVYNDGGNAGIHTAYFTNAGITNTYYDTLGSGHMIDSLTCYTFASTPHWTPSSPYSHSDSIRLNNLAAFVRNGGNFLAECEGIQAVEGFSPYRYMTNTGVNTFNAAVTTVQYMNMDMPVMQFMGGLAPGGGSVKNWNLPGGGSYKSPRFKGVYFISSSDTANIVNVTKYNSPGSVGGMMIYLGGHSYANASIADQNGQRVFLNSFLLPAFNLATSGSATSSSPYCTGDTLKLFGNPPYQGFTLNWTGPNSFTSTQQNPTIPNAYSIRQGTYTFTITTNDHSCSYPFSTTVTMASKPALTLNTTATVICEDDSVTLSLASNTGISTVSWYIDTAATCKTTGSPIGTGLTFKVYPTSTTKYIGVGYTTSGNCPDTTTNCVTVTVDKKPVITSSKSTSTPICYNSGVSATITAGSGGSGCSETYLWRQDAGAWQSYTPGTTVGTTAHDSIEIKATRNCTTSGCTNKVVRSRWTVAAPIVTTSASTLTDCADATGYVAQLSATNPSPNTGLWTKVSGAGTVQTPTSYVASISGLSLNGTSTVVKWVVTNAYGCKDSSSVTITPRVTDSSTLANYSSNFCLTCPVKNGGIYYFYDLNGKLLGTVTDISDAHSLSNTSFCANLNYSAGSTPTSNDVQTTTYDQPYLPRDWTISSDTSTPYTVSLYFSDDEVNALMAKAAQTGFPFTDPSQLSITMYPSPTGSTMPVGSPNPTLIAPVFTRVGGMWKATFTTVGSGTFYIHPNFYSYAALPVELISFTAKPNESSIVLDWSTASEKNSNHFEIERSLDGVNFQMVGSMKANGNSNSVKYYTYDDIDASINTQYYYRLKQLDNNGEFHYSRIIMAIIKTIEKLSFGNLIPNPASDATSIEISSSVETPMSVKLISMDGSVLMQKTNPLVNGVNKIDIDLSKVVTGSYIIRFETSDSVKIKRVMKIH